MTKSVLVTGASGMIGRHLVKELLDRGLSVIGIDINHLDVQHPNFRLVSMDLADREGLKSLFIDNEIDRIIHLAALAHPLGPSDREYERIKRINVDCAANVFDEAERNGVPVLFISTVDVFGTVRGLLTPESETNPATNYGVTKKMAEDQLVKTCTRYDIFRFSPIYTEDVKEHIQKRYYLRPSWLAYRVGDGAKFEVLALDKAITEMANWAEQEPQNEIRIIKDEKRLDVNEVLAREKSAGRANIVVRIPRWVAIGLYHCLRWLGLKNATYLVFKALWPFETSNKR